jgi:hypothetical protein
MPGKAPVSHLFYCLGFALEVDDELDYNKEEVDQLDCIADLRMGVGVGL